MYSIGNTVFFGKITGKEIYHEPKREEFTTNQHELLVRNLVVVRGYKKKAVRFYEQPLKNALC